MRRTILALASLLVLPSTASATWSVIAVDRSTGRVVIASATCVDRDDEFLKGVQAVVVPGKGVAACQAAVDQTHQNQMLVEVVAAEPQADQHEAEDRDQVERDRRRVRRRQLVPAAAPAEDCVARHVGLVRHRPIGVAALVGRLAAAVRLHSLAHAAFRVLGAALLQVASAGMWP